MTFFQIADEYERDFEDLELSDLEGCAFATLLYVQLGHLSAKAMTDGLVSPARLRKRTAAWAPAALDEALDALVRLGKVERTADGGVQFLDWDLTQFTAEQEARRRALAAERQRRRRAKLAAESRMVRADVIIDESDLVTRDVTPPSASSSASGSARAEEKQKEPPPPPAAPPVAAPESVARAPRKTRPKADEKRAVFDRVLAEAGARHGFIAPKLLSARQAADVIRKAEDHAKREGVTLEAALTRTFDDACERQRRTGKDLKWCVVDWQPNAAPPRPDLRYTGPKPCSPEEDFHELPIEEHMRRMSEAGAGMCFRRRVAS